MFAIQGVAIGITLLYCLAGIAALAALYLLVYLIARLFTDSDVAEKAGAIILFSVIGIAVGCVFPGLLLGAIAYIAFDSFVVGVAVGAAIGLGLGLYITLSA